MNTDANISGIGSVAGSLASIGSLTGAYQFNGLIDDVRIYNRALSAREVWALYNGGK